MEPAVVESAGSFEAVIGREAEMQAIDRALAPARLPAFVVLDGEAGIGKTTVWAAAVASARAAGTQVLSASPVAAEEKLAYTVLGDLLEPVVHELLPRLTPPQRRALEVALLLDEAHGQIPDERTAAAALLSCLRLLAAAGPVLVAIDDVQWCDVASASVLAFALRRLRADPVGVLAARRVTGAPALPLGLDRPAAPVRPERVTVGPLSLGALHQVVTRQLGVSLSRPVLRRVHETSGGNPFFALEIARAVARRGGVDPAEPLPVPDDLHELVRERLAELSPSTRDLLAMTAALAEPTARVLEAAAGATARSDLAAAYAAGVIEHEQERLRFTHPLLAAAAYAAVAPAARPAMHRRLAAVVVDPEERAHHLAASTEQPDLEVALEVEAAARRALGRGALAAAAEMFAAARRLAPAEESEIHRRLTIAEAECWVEAGDNLRGRTLLEGLLGKLRRGPERAEVLIHLGHALAWGFDWRGSVAHLQQAIEEAGDDPALSLTAQRQLMIASLLVCDDMPALLAHARRTATLAEEACDEGVLAGALALQARTEVQMGLPAPVDVIERSLALEPRIGHVTPLEWPSDYLATVDALTDRVPEGIDALERIRDALTDRGQDTAASWTVGRISQLRCLVGDLDQARAEAMEACEFTQQAGQPANQATLAATLALVEAHRGAESESRRWAEQALELGDAAGAVPARRMARAALGMLELSLGRAGAAREVLDPLLAEMRDAGYADPNELRFTVDSIEARLAVGELDGAESLLDWYEELSARLRRRSALAACRRCRGLLAAARGDADAAIDLLQEALDLYSEVALPLERARTLLALGSVQRRAKRKREARATLQSALAEFDRLGAAAWRARAADELASIGGRTSAGDELTATEKRVAELVASGASNRDVAAALFLSPKTVEFHLRNVFRKIGINSRAQLGPRLRDQG